MYYLTTPKGRDLGEPPYTAKRDAIAAARLLIRAGSPCAVRYIRGR